MMASSSLSVGRTLLASKKKCLHSLHSSFSPVLNTSCGNTNVIRPALSRNVCVATSSSANKTVSGNVAASFSSNKGYYRFFQQTASSMVFGMAGTTTAAVVTLCDDGNKGNGDEDILTKIKNMVSDPDGKANEIATVVGSKIQDAVDTGMPTQLSYGFVCGFCSGYAMRKVGQVGAVIFGMGFCALQTLSYYGYVQVDHDRIKKDFEGLMDLNDDGKIDQEDVNILSDKVMKVISYNVPGGSGFAAGFVGGLRSGR